MLFPANLIAWHTQAGQRLEEFARALPEQPKLLLTVFGSAPLQLLVEPTFVSADIDLFGEESCYDFLTGFIEQQKWTQKDTDYYIQICDSLAFKSTVDWPLRATEVTLHGHSFRIVHPWDVLVSKLQRLEEKDLNAFKLVLGKTGHPTEAEFIRHLQKAVDLYRPKFDEETARGDMLMNTRILWHELWHRDIDVRAEIIRPAILRAEREYQDFDPTLKDRLAEIGRRPA